MQFNNIGDLLKRFKGLKPTDAHIKDKLIGLLKSTYGIEVVREDIRVQNSVVFLHIHPTIKTSIFLGKKELLRELNEGSGKHPIKDIV